MSRDNEEPVFTEIKADEASMAFIDYIDQMRKAVYGAYGVSREAFESALAPYQEACLNQILYGQDKAPEVRIVTPRPEGRSWFDEVLARKTFTVKAIEDAPRGMTMTASSEPRLRGKTATAVWIDDPFTKAEAFASIDWAKGHDSTVLIEAGRRCGKSETQRRFIEQMLESDRYDALVHRFMRDTENLVPKHLEHKHPIAHTVGMNGAPR